jgi:PAS domain S-box-containing protein
VIGAIRILRDMRELDKVLAYAESFIKNAPDPVFVSDLEGKILQANDAVFALLGFRPDELIEQSEPIMHALRLTANLQQTAAY